MHQLGGRRANLDNPDCVGAEPKLFQGYSGDGGGDRQQPHRQNRFFARSYFIFQVQAAGIDINAGREVVILQRRKIAEVMEAEYHTIAPEANYLRWSAALRDNPEADLYVTEANGRLLGSITLGAAWEALFAKAGKAPSR